MRDLDELGIELEELVKLYEEGQEDYDGVLQLESDLMEAQDDSREWDALNRQFQNFKEENDLDDGYDEGDMRNMMLPNG
ncbi:hypothetical protein [Leeuwenhoekiella marinoflava]|uniref:Uncharacterized protein n=2 Tax=Leeuwenhoekiella marinoflava TaxID=988 RepID=A0A4Q0PLE8_9FLAO|nr:hypothetical protein [Leeuwenhoekiella marinoflava]RXG29878.1 hypothetical protein DSL99_1931 [Leeuwenhoekiella marinoflava]SHF27530.1 hypothetical protein SAMN02745246_02106 [Leeuwenhoekiella marinoflava DSM 3653]